MLRLVIFAAICTPIAVGYSGNPYITAAKLGSLAQSSALHAKSAVAYQNVAASHATFTAKNELARAALNAASTAQAALAAEKLAIETLKRQLEDAEKVLQAEIEQYEVLQEISAAFNKTAHDARSQVDALTLVVEAVRSRTAKAAAEAASEGGDVSFGGVKNEIAKPVTEATSEEGDVSFGGVKNQTAKPAAEAASEGGDVKNQTAKPVAEATPEELDISFGSGFNVA